MHASTPSAEPGFFQEGLFTTLPKAMVDCFSVAWSTVFCALPRAEPTLISNATILTQNPQYYMKNMSTPAPPTPQA